MRLRRHAYALLLDFDGVLRHYDPAVAGQVEESYGLAPGTLLATGLEWPRYLPAMTGVWTRRQWLDSIAEAAGVPARALTEWDADRGALDPSVLAFVREVRAAGRPVALATNATDDLRQDLALLGIADDFDAVVSSAELGTHKPTREFFAAACAAVGTPADQCLFVDDTARNIKGARVAGLAAYRWSGPADLTYVRSALGLGRLAPETAG